MDTNKDGDSRITGTEIAPQMQMANQTLPEIPVPKTPTLKRTIRVNRHAMASAAKRWSTLARK
jgi:hypothetical protein